MPASISRLVIAPCNLSYPLNLPTAYEERTDEQCPAALDAADVAMESIISTAEQCHATSCQDYCTRWLSDDDAQVARPRGPCRRKGARLLRLGFVLRQRSIYTTRDSSSIHRPTAAARALPQDRADEPDRTGANGVEADLYRMGDPRVNIGIGNADVYATSYMAH